MYLKHTLYLCSACAKSSLCSAWKSFNMVVSFLRSSISALSRELYSCNIWAASFTLTKRKENFYLKNLHHYRNIQLTWAASLVAETLSSNLASIATSETSGGRFAIRSRTTASLDAEFSRSTIALISSSGSGASPTAKAQWLQTTITHNTS